MLKKTLIFIVSLIIITMTTGIVIAQPSGDGKAFKGKKGKKGSRPLREDKGPKAGIIAPTFKLMALDGKQEFDLESFRDKKPVVLFFGSYT